MTTSTDKPDYLGHRQRLRERFEVDDGRSMPDYELLEFLLTAFIPRRDVKPIAKRLLAKFKDLAGVFSASRSELEEVDGIKSVASNYLKAIHTSNIRSNWRTLQSDDAPIICKTEVLEDYCRSAMAHLDIEECRLLYLNTKMQLIGEEILQRGTINHVAIHPREIVKHALQQGATSVIMVHNHPSGDATPSKADIELTRQINVALRAIEINMLDHIIVSKNMVYSLKAHHLF